MKEKITLFIALSFLVGLTAYKKSFSTEINLASNTNIELDENIEQENMINGDSLHSKEEIKNPINCKSNQADTDELKFADAFKYYRNCNHDTFTWKGIEYTTTLKQEINESLRKNDVLLNQELDLVVK